LEKPIVAVEGIVTDSAAVIETEEPSGKMAVTGSPPLGSEPASVFKAKVAALLAWLSAILPLCRPIALAVPPPPELGAIQSEPSQKKSLSSSASHARQPSRGV
jgi:hypothetical protein